MVASVEQLVNVANCKITTTAQFNSCNVALMVATSDAYDTASLPSSVATLASLPDATENKGRFYFVTDESQYYVSDGTEWVKDFTSVAEGRQIWTWGDGGSGNLGDGSTTNRSSPGTTSGGGTNWCFVSRAAGIKTDGTLWTWGYNSAGGLGDGTNSSRSSPGTTAGGGTTWCTISKEDNNRQRAAIKTDGTLWTWGDGRLGALGSGSNAYRSSPGTTSGAGTTWCQAASGSLHMLAVKQDGTLWTWGRNCSAGTLGDGSNINRSSPGTTAGGGTNWCQATASYAFSGAVKQDGTLWTWGSSETVGLLGDGASNTPRSSPGTTAGGGTNWCQIESSCSSTHVVALKQDGTVWAWGRNTDAELGDGSNINRSSPVTTAGGGTNWCFVSAGYRNGAAIKTDGTLWTWGLGTTGQLGLGNTNSSCSPVTVIGGITTWSQVNAGRVMTALTALSKGF